jgi:hypothetical protein
VREDIPRLSNYLLLYQSGALHWPGLGLEVGVVDRKAPVVGVNCSWRRLLARGAHLVRDIHEVVVIVSS